MLGCASPCVRSSSLPSSSDSSPPRAPATTTTPSSTTAPEATSEADLGGDGLTIGFIRPPAGLFDLLGAAQAGGVALAADDIAAGGGVLGGPLTIVEGEPEPARGADVVFDDLVGEGVNLIVGPSSSEEAQLIIPKIAAADAVVCGASTTAPGLPELPEAEGRFVRTSFDDNVVALHAFDRIRERTASIVDRAPRVALVVAWRCVRRRHLRHVGRTARPGRHRGRGRALRPRGRPGGGPR